jgi:hypothetical protein
MRCAYRREIEVPAKSTNRPYEPGAKGARARTPYPAGSTARKAACKFLTPSFSPLWPLAGKPPPSLPFTRERAEDHLTVEFRGDIYFLEPAEVP